MQSILLLLLLLLLLSTLFCLQGSAGAESDKVQLQYSPLSDVLAAPTGPLASTTHAMYYVLLGEPRIAPRAAPESATWPGNEKYVRP
jgi:hypothetical protein